MRVWVERNKRATGATYSTVWQDDTGRRSRRTYKARHEALDLRDNILAGELPPPLLATHTAPEGGPAGRSGLTVPTPWVDFIASFWTMCDQENRPSTIRRYRTIVRNFERDCGPQTVQEVDQQTAMGFREAALRRPRGQRTLTRAGVNHEIKVLRRVFNHAVGLGLVRDNPFSSLKPLKETDGLCQMVVLETGEIEEFKTHCRPEFLPYFLLLVRTGMRRGEMHLLGRDDYLRQEGWLRITNAKTATSAQDLYRFFPLDGRMNLMLDRRLERVKGDQLYPARGCNYLIDNLRSTARLLVRKGKLSPTKANIRIHDLRHTFASQFLAHGGDLRTLMTLLGHNRLETTERYLHVLDSQLKGAASIIGY